jgi:uncharacterized protein (TIGR02452 family)
MGREHPTFGMAPNATRRAERAKRARQTLNKVIPDMLRSSPRARHALNQAELVVDPDIPTMHGTTALSSLPDQGPEIRILCTDTLDAAARISDRPFAARRTGPSTTSKPNVAILSFASPLKPGGGFLEGANSQEEFICARSTLYPSLWDSFYRLPEIGGVYTPDVMVFRDSTPEANELIKRDRFFVDVISAGMLRFPALRGRMDEKVDHGCTCGVAYCDRDRDLVTRKMKAVMRMAQEKGVERLVLGAWGCGAYGNPVKQVAAMWRKVISGSQRQRRPNAERWQGIKEIIFAIPDFNMLREFELAFSGVLSMDAPSPASAEVEAEREQNLPEQTAEMAELVNKIQETELQIEMIQNPRSRQRLREVLSALNRELAQGLAAQRMQEDELTKEADEGVEEDGFVTVDGVLASDGEENSVYNIDDNDLASDSSDATVPEAFEFKPQPPGLDFETSMDEDEPDNDSHTYSLLQPSPNFDTKTGWFAGSIDQLQGLIIGGSGARQASHASPVMRPESSGPVIPEFALNDYLERFEGQSPVESRRAFP